MESPGIILIVALLSFWAGIIVADLISRSCRNRDRDNWDDAAKRMAKEGKAAIDAELERRRQIDELFR